LTYRWATATRADKPVISAAIETPLNGTAAWVSSQTISPAFGWVDVLAIVILISLGLTCPCEVQPTPLREFSKPRRWRKSNGTPHVQFHTWHHGQTPPQRARDQLLASWFGAPPVRHLTKRASNVDKRSAVFLHRLHTKQLLEMLGRVVIAATETQRRRDQTFLHVIPDCPARHAAERGEFSNRISNGGRHRENKYATVTVTLSTVTF
jgi:hypothetical protein